MSVDNSPATRPPRTARPKDRKQQILTAAADLFVRLGFPAVTMGMIAESVGITAGGLYRHYANKADLLAAVARHSFEGYPMPTPGLSFDELVSQASITAVRFRELGPLWTRQAEYLPEADRAELRARLLAVNRAYSVAVREYRDDVPPVQSTMLAWTLQSMLASAGFHTSSLSQPEFAGELKAACMRVADSRLDAASSAPEPQFGLQPASRREHLLEAAITLFGRDGVHSTSMEAIGAAAGVSGPSLYTHFESKEAILLAALDRATQALWLSLMSALRSTTDPRVALRAIVDDYAHLSHGWLSIASLIKTENAKENRDVQREYVGEWVALLRSCRPELDQAHAQVRVHAALTVIHDAVQADRAGHPDMYAQLHALTWAILGAEPEEYTN